MNPWYHAVSSVKKWGGRPEDYLPIHDFFDESKAHYADQRHRALRHHSAGIFECEAKFGHTITNSDNRTVPVRAIGEQHVMEDCGFIPTVKDWLQNIQLQPWMRKVAMRSKDVEKLPDCPAGKEDDQWLDHYPAEPDLLPPQT